jgi:hypothetical protein
MQTNDGVRRVVTGHDESGKAIVLFDSIDPHASSRPGTANVRRSLWATQGSPAQIDGPCDRMSEQTAFLPSAAGSIFRIIDFPSMTDDEIAQADSTFYAAQTSHAGDSSRYRRSSHPFMHRTRTLDYAIVLQGAIEMKLDDELLAFKAGDVVVQQGTNHAWINRSGAMCRIAFVLIDATDPFG